MQNCLVNWKCAKSEICLTLVDFLIEQKNRNQMYFLEYKKYASLIKQVASEVLHQKKSEFRVLVFGSVVRGNWLPNKSDIDILIISDRVSLSAHWQSQVRLRIFEALTDAFGPFQIHFTTPERYKDWYANFIKDDYVEVN